MFTAHGIVSYVLYRLLFNVRTWYRTEFELIKLQKRPKLSQSQVEPNNYIFLEANITNKHTQMESY